MSTWGYKSPIALESGQALELGCCFTCVSRTKRRPGGGIGGIRLCYSVNLLSRGLWQKVGVNILFELVIGPVRRTLNIGYTNGVANTHVKLSTALDNVKNLECCG